MKSSGSLHNSTAAQRSPDFWQKVKSRFMCTETFSKSDCMNSGRTVMCPTHKHRFCGKSKPYRSKLSPPPIAWLASKIENQGNPHIYWNDNNNHLPIPWDSKSYMSHWWWAIFNSETSPMPSIVKKNWETNWLLSTTKCVIRPDESLQWYQQRRLWKGQQGLVEQRSHCSQEGNYKRWQ